MPEIPKPPAKPFEAARWEDLPGWPGSDANGANGSNGSNGLLPSFRAFLASCDALKNRELWRETCASAQALETQSNHALRNWFETQLQPWQLVNPDGSREGLVTGYYEPLLKGSRTRQHPYLAPIYGIPDDLIDVELGEINPDLKHLRLRGRIEGRKLVPYYSRADWNKQEARRKDGVLLWADDAFDVFFMQIQGSGQVQLDDGSRVRVGYADQNGHPYRSIGRWLIDRGELKLSRPRCRASRPGPRRIPSVRRNCWMPIPAMSFPRTGIGGAGPPGALGVPLTEERSIAVIPATPLGAGLAVHHLPNSGQALTRLMLAQDTGGACGPVRADFYWGSGNEAGIFAGRMRQKGQMWHCCRVLTRRHRNDAAEHKFAPVLCILLRQRLDGIYKPMIPKRTGFRRAFCSMPPISATGAPIWII